jgi:methionine synthase II (cobalamin-independent)
MAKTIYRSDQVGSLLRPRRLLDARDAFKAGRIDRDALAEEEDVAVVDVLGRQRQIGLSRVETRDELMRRIDEAASYCAIDQLALTSQCGFQGAATRDGAHVDEETQWRKLERIAEVSREVWQ